MNFPRREVVEAVRARYPKGTRVELVWFLWTIRTPRSNPATGVRWLL